MEDFDYSVEICDRDWECFFKECEECNLLPPSLAGEDDSGMSDMDDTGSILTNRDQKVNQTARFVEVDGSIDGPPDCEGSPVELYLSKHGIGGMESVLSGSEEDIHLQSVNIFFERLKSLTEAEKITEPNQVGARKNREAAVQEEEQCSDGQQASCTGCTLPKNIPKLNFLSARGETVVGRETVEAVNTVSNINTMKTDEPGSKISPEPSASNSVLHTYKSAHPETGLFIREEACTENRVNEIIESNDSPDKVVWSEVTPHSDKEINLEVETCRPLCDVRRGDFFRNPPTLIKSQYTDSSRSVDMVTNVKWREDKNDAESTNKPASQESSPSASFKRKRRKKRRLSVEPAESGFGYEKDSEEEQCLWRGRMDPCLQEDLYSSYLREPQKKYGFTTPLNTYLVTSSLPVNVSVKEKKVKDLYHSIPSCDSQHLKLQDSVFKEASLTENISTDDRLQSQTDDSDVSAQTSSCNVATDLQPCRKLKAKDGLHEYAAMTLSITDCERDTSALTTEKGNCEREDIPAGSLMQSNKMNQGFACENEQNSKSCASEVKSVTHAILPSAESNHPNVDVCQNDRVSTAKSVMGVDAGSASVDSLSLCQRVAEPQQLETECHDTYQYSYMLEKTLLPLSVIGSDVQDLADHNTKTHQFKTTAFYEKGPDRSRLSLDKHCLNPSSLSIDISVKQTEHPPEHQKLSKEVDSFRKLKTTERAQVAVPRVMGGYNGNLFPYGEMNQTGNRQIQTNPKLSASEDLSVCLSNTTPPSCCTVETQSLESLSNENITDALGSSCCSSSQSGPRCEEKSSQILTTAEKREETSQDKSQDVSHDTKEPNGDFAGGAEVAMVRSQIKDEPVDAKCSVYAMSSFWKEMEKITINDILGLRLISKNPPSSLPALQETEDTDLFTMDSGFFSRVDDSNLGQTSMEASNVPNPVDSNSSSVIAVDASSYAMWESEPVSVGLPAGIYPESMSLTTVSDISQPVRSDGAQKSLRKISKNVSVHNLRALESEAFNYTYKGETLQILEEEECTELEYVTEEHVPKQDPNSLTSVSSESYRISLTDIFQYLFGGKQSIPSQSPTDSITNCFADGNSVPETYDHFFSEFDTDTFFYPLITADEAKDEPVPIFSCSRSTNRNLQFPEAYDYFFVSSSSDDSSDEEDKDERSPVRVVTRLPRNASANQISTDIYDNFFTDSDLRQNFFWPKSFSFRNIHLTGHTIQKQSSNSLSIPVRQRPRPLRRNITPINALGSQDLVFPEPLLYHLEDRISRQLQQQPFRFEDLQTAVANPRLDSSFLPLKHSDMCLVCIAFASWVLKTANPQVGDAWKAVLLANVSALSAIRYLRKYVKVEAAVAEKK